MKQFSVDEIEDIFNNIVVNGTKHRTGTYVTLDEEAFNTDVGYFEECMKYFLHDLRLIANDEYDKKGNKITAINDINNYENVMEALKHMNQDMYLDQVIIVTNDYSQIYNPGFNASIKDLYAADFIQQYLDCNSYYITYYANGSLVIILHK